MVEHIHVSNPVKIQDNSAERVAFDLMNIIAHNENYMSNNMDSRTYYLTLYRQCLKVVNNSSRTIEEIIKNP